ncbi:hypothetical protein A2U01_0068444, partial [Trifolium medium]|nr:hypothetical protein [Trifolium medium]
MCIRDRARGMDSNGKEPKNLGIKEPVIKPNNPSNSHNPNGMDRVNRVGPSNSKTMSLHVSEKQNTMGVMRFEASACDSQLDGTHLKPPDPNNT